MCGNTTPFYKIEYNVDHQREAPTQIDMYLSNRSRDHSQPSTRGLLPIRVGTQSSMHSG